MQMAGAVWGGVWCQPPVRDARTAECPLRPQTFTWRPHTTPGPSTVVMNNIATNTPTLSNFNKFFKMNKMENRIKSIKEIYFIWAEAIRDSSHSYNSILLSRVSIIQSALRQMRDWGIFLHPLIFPTLTFQLADDWWPFFPMLPHIKISNDQKLL